jgi:hypothetical protein
MSFEISDSHRSAFAQDGIVKLEGAINSELLKQVQTCWDWSVAHPGPIATGKQDTDQVFFVDNGNPDARTMYESLVNHSPFPRMAADLWQSKFVGFVAEEVFWKKGTPVKQKRSGIRIRCTRPGVASTGVISGYRLSQ